MSWVPGKSGRELTVPVIKINCLHVWNHQRISKRHFIFEKDLKKDAILSYLPIWPFPINNRIKASLLYTNIKALWFWSWHILSSRLLWGMWSHEHTRLLVCLPVFFQAGFFAWSRFNFIFPLVYISGSQTFLECLSSEDFAKIQMLVYEVWHWYPNCLFLPSPLLFFPPPPSLLFILLAMLVIEFRVFGKLS